MLMPLQVTFHGLDRSETLEGEVRRRALRLEDVCGSSIGCRVTVTLRESAHPSRNADYTVHLDVTLHGRELVAAAHHHNEDVNVALRDAFDAVKRQITDHARRSRNQSLM